MRVRVLGPIEAGDASGIGPRDRVVLAALAVRPGEVLAAEVLADALWGERPPASWAKVVQGCVSRLRRLVGTAAIETTPVGYRLVRAHVDLDRDEFEELAARGREYLATGSPERAVAAFEAALGLWSGRPFPDLEDWEPGRLEAARLAEVRLGVQDDLLTARLEAGEHAQVAVDGTVLVREEPWRERRWSLLALAQYRCGRQAEALATIRTARRALGRQLGLDPGSELVGLERAILDQDPGLAAEHAARAASSSCPWRGLASYDPEDSETFFGRTDDIAACLARLEESPLLALAGPSGCGKSSLLKAGLVPSLRRTRGNVVSFTPGLDPRAALTAALASAPGDPVVCVDQFEELFTGPLDAEGRREVLARLAAYATDRAPVLLTVRSDYLTEMSAEPGFAGLVERGLHLVAPLDDARLRETIEGPARVAGLRLEHGLVDLLLRDATDQPGALPLLSHALAETWQRREGSLLTVDGYRDSGGISGAVAASADRLCASLPASGQAQLRWLMLRMGALADHGEPVRTPLPGAIATDDPERTQVLDLLVGARLVTSADGSYELAHESLIRAWPTLRGWLEEDRDGQRLWRHLAAAAQEWDRLDRPDSELYQGVRLEAAHTWARQAGSQPTRLERDFLDASEAHADAERRALAEQARHQRRQNKRLRTLLGGVAALLVVSLLATLMALDQRRSAAGERDVARGARAAAQHESLVARSLDLRSSKRDLAALLAVEAHRQRPGALADSAMLGTFTGADGFLGYSRVPFDVIQGATIPGTDKAVVASGTRMHVVDLESRELGPAFPHPLSFDKPLVSVVRVSGDGRRVAQLMFTPGGVDRCMDYEDLQTTGGRGCTVLVVFDVATRELLLGPVATPFQGGDLAINRTGGTVAVVGGFDGDLATYDVDRGRRLGRLLPGPARPEDYPNIRDTGAVAFDPRGDVYVGSMAGPIRRVDARTLAVRETIAAPRGSSNNFVYLTRDLVVGAGDEAIVAYDRTTGRRTWWADLTQNTDDWPCSSFVVAERLQRAYCGNQHGRVDEYDLANGQLTGFRLDTQRGEVGDLAISGGNELVEFSRGYFSRWRLDGSGAIASLLVPDAQSPAGYDDTGRYLTLQARNRGDRVRVMDLTTGRTTGEAPTDGYVSWAGPHTLVTGLASGGKAVLDTTTGDRRDVTEGPLAESIFVFPGVDGQHLWASYFVPGQDEEGSGGSAPHELYEVRELVLDSGRPTGRRFTVPGFPFLLMYAPDRRSAWVNYARPEGSSITWEDETNLRGRFIDLETGRTGREIVAAASAIGGRDGAVHLVASDFLGGIREYDQDSLRPVATLPGARGFVWNMGFSADGRRLVVSAVDGAVLLYDIESRIRLAEIPTSAAEDVPQGWVRPDGTAVLVNGRRGVVAWDLDPEDMASAACRVAGRNLTRAEWATYVGDVSYHRTCPAYPAGE